MSSQDRDSREARKYRKIRRFFDGLSTSLEASQQIPRHTYGIAKASLLRLYVTALGHARTWHDSSINWLKSQVKWEDWANLTAEEQEILATIETYDNLARSHPMQEQYQRRADLWRERLYESIEGRLNDTRRTRT